MSPTQQAISRDLRRRYWFPCRGYWSSASRDALREGVMTGASTADSFNCLVSSQEGNVVRRRGIAYYGESDVTAQAGLLEAVTKNLTMNMTARCGLDVQYPSATPGSIVGPTYLYTDLLDTGHFGQLYVLTSTQGTRKVLGHEMGTLASPGTTHYPRSATNANLPPNFRMIPLPYMAGGSGTQAVGYNRCTFPLMRALLCGGAMKMVQAGNYVLVGSLHGTPMKWDRRSNPSTSTGSEKAHIAPWGHITPICKPQAVPTSFASTGTNDRIWWDGDQFYLSFVFQMEDDSFSAPMQPRPRNATLPSGLGLITVGSTSGNSSYYALGIINVPLGPPGTKARLICRTRKTNVSTATTRPAGMTPQGATSDLDAAGQKLYVMGIIKDNRTSQFAGTQSNDDVILDDPIAINPFYIWPLPARHAFEMERRVALGYTRRQGPCAIQLTVCQGIGSSSALNADEDGFSAGGVYGTLAGSNGPFGSLAHCWRLYKDTAGTMTLSLRAASIGAGTITTEGTIGCAGVSVQDVIDGINATAVSEEWGGQPIPGTDTGISAQNLAPSVFDVATCTLAASSTITSSAGFADVAVGNRVKVQSGTGTVPASSIVIAKASDSSITIGNENGTAANATAGTATLRFWSDTGDDSWSTDTATWDVGNVRTFGPAFPAVIALSGKYLDSFPLDKQGIIFTNASPGAASLAPQSFANRQANRVSAPTDAGVCMGGAPVIPNAVAFYSEGVFAFENVRNTNTGEDQDYHLYRLTPKGQGCIQYGTIAWGTGWGGCLTAEGYLVTDGRQHRIITNALLDPAHGGRGILAYQALALASQNGSADLPQYQTAHALVVDGTLRLSVKPNASLA